LADVGSRGESLARVYDMHGYQVYGFLAYRVRTREEAEDLTQLTFERALRAWDRYDPRKGTLTTWLLSIARNLLIDHCRRDHSGALVQLPDDGGTLCAHGADPAEQLGVDPRIDAALQVLDDRERELIALRFGGDMSGCEVAAMTGLTLANTQQIQSRALRKMRAQLEAQPSRSEQTLRV
jgi:RNA polymerase sigma factor (sigma-70 family)